MLRAKTMRLDHALLVAGLLSTALAWGQTGAPAEVVNCHPCSFSPAAGLPSYSFTFDLKTDTMGRSVEGIEVARDGKPLQRLAVHGMSPVDAGETFFFGGQDINFDGKLDLILITSRGAANASAAYWLFDPATGTFKELGTYPVFQVDAAKHRLSTYVGGGFGGMVYAAKEYSFVAGQLVLQRTETQSATQRPGNFRKVTRIRVGTAMKVARTEMVTAPSRTKTP